VSLSARIEKLRDIEEEFETNVEVSLNRYGEPDEDYGQDESNNKVEIKFDTEVIGADRIKRIERLEQVEALIECSAI